MIMDDYKHLPDPPSGMSANAALRRVIDAIGFRFYWATEGLRPADLSYTPGEGVKTIGEIMDHIRDLLNWMATSLPGAGFVMPERTTREQALFCANAIARWLDSREDVLLDSLRIRDEGIWHWIHGPLTDGLTHIGQINTLRRLNGNPGPPVRYFSGTIREDWQPPTTD